MPIRRNGKGLKCCLCGRWNLGVDVVELAEDSSCISVWGKRVWVPAGWSVCSSHRPMAFFPVHGKTIDRQSEVIL